MPRTFTLARLMVGIALFAIALGLFAKLPVELRNVGNLVGIIAPTLVVWLSLVRFSRHPLVLLTACLIGTAAIYMMSPAILHSLPPLPSSCTVSDAPWAQCFAGAMCGTIGGYLLGATALVEEFRAPQAKR